MSAFADLHRPGDPLVLPNAWDHASAAALAAAGFAAIGTTSLGVAAALGLADGAAETAEATSTSRTASPSSPCRSRWTSRTASRPTPPRSPPTSTGSARWPASTSRTSSPTRPTSPRCSSPSSGRDEVFINARVDTYWLGDGGVDATLERARAYIAAGADGIFVPGVEDERRDRPLAEALARPAQRPLPPGTLTVPRLAELGVARISTGSLLYRVALGAALDAAPAVFAGRRKPPGRDRVVPSYAEVDGLAS